MIARLMPLIIWPLIVLGGFTYWLINSYQKVKQYPQMRYNLVPNASLPVELSDLVRQSKEAGFQYLGTYSVTLPHAFKQKPPDSYTLQNDQNTLKLMLSSFRRIKSASFQTLFEDGAMLVTASGVITPPLMPMINSDRLQIIQSKGSLAEAMQLHNVKVAEWEPLHGMPNSTSNAQEYLDLMNEFVVAHGHQQVAQSTAKLFRTVALVAGGLYLLTICSLLSPMLLGGSSTVPSNPLGVLGITSIPYVVFIGMPLFMHFKIRYDFLRES